MLTFRSGGVVDCSAGVMVETTYRIEGGEMILPSTGINGPELRQKIEFVGQDQLRLGEVVLRRQGPAPDTNHAILGEWVAKIDIDGGQLEKYYLFYPGGKCLFLLPFFKGNPGRYSIQGSTMRLELPGTQASEGKFQIEGDLLTIPGPGGSRERFRRY